MRLLPGWSPADSRGRLSHICDFSSFFLSYEGSFPAAAFLAFERMKA
jgi:hypothetical protein